MREAAVPTPLRGRCARSADQIEQQKHTEEKVPTAHCPRPPPRPPSTLKARTLSLDNIHAQLLRAPTCQLLRLVVIPVYSLVETWEITPEQQCTSRCTARRRRGTGTPAATRRRKKRPSQRNVTGAPEEHKTITFIFRGEGGERKKSDVKMGPGSREGVLRWAVDLHITARV